MGARIDWEALRAAAREVMHSAYAPYSRYPVGVAGLVDDGRVVVGCNVENASYGVTLCAECGMVGALHAGGGGRLVAVACVDGAGMPLMPCGRCRQLLWEHGGPDCLVDHADGPLPVSALLPYAFDDTDLGAGSGGSGPPSPVPPALLRFRGRGTAFVHPDMVGGTRVWTGYWERSTGAGGTGPDSPAGILQEGPTWPTAGEGVRWARQRTGRVIVVDADGQTWWAGDGEPPAAVSRRWPPAGPGPAGGPDVPGPGGGPDGPGPGGSGGGGSR